MPHNSSRLDPTPAGPHELGLQRPRSDDVAGGRSGASRFLAPLAFALSVAAFGYAAGLPAAGAAATAAAFLAMAAPGVLLVGRALGEDASALVVLVCGAALGLALGRFGLAVVS